MASMASLPPELLRMILYWVIRMSPSDKNSITPLRRVSKSFAEVLQPYLFKTLQLEFSKFARYGGPKVTDVARMGEFCHAIYLDMMVVRDEEEIARLSDVFQGITSKIPEMESLIQALRKYCMNDTTFDETDFARVMGQVLDAAPNLARLRVNLPFQVVGRTSSTATLLLANILASIANRSEEHPPLEVLVLDHLSDTTITNLCSNPQDVKNAVATFAGLKNLVLSIKRQEARNSRQSLFTQQIWYLIRKAAELESLCIIGWNVKRDIGLRRHRHIIGFNEWNMRSLPYQSDLNVKLQNLRSLELKRVDIDPEALVTLLVESSTSLKEVYLNEVYLKVNGSRQHEETPLWIGHHDSPKLERCCWVAEALRKSNLQLDILRVTGLGYDDFDPDRESAYPNYDLTDPSGLDRSFDQRFVEAVMQPSKKATIPGTVLEDQKINQNGGHGDDSPEDILTGDAPMPDLVTDTSLLPGALIVSDSNYRLLSEYDVEAYQALYQHNTTSHFKKCIDGYFNNHNERALVELQRIIAVADRGMTLISNEIDRSHAAEVTEDGSMAIP